jgi:hypothetical protein
MMKWLRNPDPEKIPSSEAAFAYATFVMRSANSNTDIVGIRYARDERNEGHITELF